jgi:hypothetical protein
MSADKKRIDEFKLNNLRANAQPSYYESEGSKPPMQESEVRGYSTYDVGNSQREQSGDVRNRSPSKDTDGLSKNDYDLQISCMQRMVEWLKGLGDPRETKLPRHKYLEFRNTIVNRNTNSQDNGQAS